MKISIPRAMPVLAVVLLVLSLLGGCSRGGDGDGDSGAASDSTAVATDDVEGDDEEEAEEEEEEAVPVQVSSLRTGPMEAVIRASANLEAERQVQVFAEASRRVLRLMVEEGDVVKAGQVLCQLQDDQQRTALGRAKAQLDKFQRELDHQKSLHESGLTTDKAMNDASADYDSQLLAVQDAERELGYASVRAPIAGTITERMVKVGDQVNVGQQLFDMIDFQSLVARVYIPEKELSMLAKGQMARVYARALTELPFSASVDRVAPIVDARSGTIKVTVAVGGQQGLRPGLFVDVELVTATHPTALRIPKRALVYDNDQIFLYRVTDESRVERVLVIPQLADHDAIEPITGFAAGEQVVVAGQAGLKDGSLIEIVSTSGDAAEAAGK